MENKVIFLVDVIDGTTNYYTKEDILKKYPGISKFQEGEPNHLFDKNLSIVVSSLDDLMDFQNEIHKSITIDGDLLTINDPWFNEDSEND